MPRKGGRGRGGGRGGRTPKKNRSSPRKSPQRRNHHHNNNQHESSFADNPSLALKERGNDAFQKADFERAIELYSQAIRLDATNHTVYANRSASYLKLHSFDEAIADANTCIELMPVWPKGYIRKACVYEEFHQWLEARETYALALETCPPHEHPILQHQLDQLEDKKLFAMDVHDKIVGGHHEQTDKFRRLIDWLIQGGATFPKLFLKFYSSEYRAIHCMERIAKDEDICFIPHDHIMTSDVAKSSEIGMAIINSTVELRSKHSYLASYLLQEKERGAESQWFPYMTVLPERFETIPLFFDEEMRKLLTGSISLRKIDDRIESLKLEYEALCEHVEGFDRFTHQDFVWARLVVITRIFGLVIDGVKTDGLVAMADMLNHKRPRETKWTYDQKKRGFVITALQHIKRDAEVFDSYGRKCNSRFFVNYGFSLEFNLDNEALMEFEISQNDSQFSVKARYLGNLGLRREFQIPMQYREKKVKECFSFLRFLHAHGPELLMITPPLEGTKKNPIEDVPPISIANESRVLTALAVAARKSLAKFETALPEDNALLADEENYPRFGNMRNAILMRRGEKEVLTFYVNLAHECLPLLKLTWKSLKQQITRRFKNQDDPIGQYIHTVVANLVKHQR